MTIIIKTTDQNDWKVKEKENLNITSNNSVKNYIGYI